MAREINVRCDICGTVLPMERAKEALFETGQNVYEVADLCPSCLDDQLQRAESVNDTAGFRQQAAALIRLPDATVPTGV